MSYLGDDMIKGKKRRKRKRRKRKPKISDFSKHSKGTKQLMEVFSPLFLLFQVTPTGNLFKDFNELAEKLTDEDTFLRRIFSMIFDQYDVNSDGVVDENELGTLLNDVGAAIGDPKLENIPKQRLRMILNRIDTNKNGLIEREELILYLLQWVQFEEDFSPVPAIPPYKGDDSYYPEVSSYGGSGSSVEESLRSFEEGEGEGEQIKVTKLEVRKDLDNRNRYASYESENGSEKTGEAASDTESEREETMEFPSIENLEEEEEDV